MVKLQSYKQYFFLLLASILSLPVVFASPLEPVVRVFTNVTTIPLLQQPEYLAGFYRACFFVIYLALFNLLLKKVFTTKDRFGGTDSSQNRAASVIAVVISLIGAFVTPAQFILVSGNLIMALLALGIGLAPSLALMWYSVKDGKGSTEKAFMGWAGMMASFAFYNFVYANILDVLLRSFQGATYIANEMLEWTYLIYMILIFYTFYRFISQLTGMSISGGSNNTGLTTTTPSGTPTTTSTPSISAGAVHGVLLPPGDQTTPIVPSSANLWWSQVTGAQEYVIEVNTRGGHRRFSRGWNTWVRHSTAPTEASPLSTGLPSGISPVAGMYLYVRMRVRDQHGRLSSPGTVSTIVQESGSTRYLTAELSDFEAAIRNLAAIRDDLNSLRAAAGGATLNPALTAELVRLESEFRTARDEAHNHDVAITSNSHFRSARLGPSEASQYAALSTDFNTIRRECLHALHELSRLVPP